MRIIKSEGLQIAALLISIGDSDRKEMNDGKGKKRILLPELRA